MSEKPLIGLTSYGRMETGSYSLPAEYILSVRRAGGIPVMLPPGETELEQLIRHLDGIVLCGGGDIDPARYDGKSHPMIYNVDAERDETEFRLLRLILKKKVPALAICRGIQVLNIYFGGNLHEHLSEVFGESVPHRCPPKATVTHPVHVYSGSKLYDIVQASSLEIVSWHHQAVKDIPRELTVTAKSEDGVVEGLELDSHPWLVAVQWHPELSSDKDEKQHLLFKAFVEAAAKS